MIRCRSLAGLMSLLFVLIGSAFAQKPELVVQTGHSSGVTSLAFRSDGTLLATASADGPIKIWEVASGRELRTLTGHRSSVNSVAFSPDGRLLASGSGEPSIFVQASSDKTVKLWDVTTGRELRTLTGHSLRVNSVVFSVDGKLLASGSEDKTIKVWDVATGQNLRTLSGHSSDVNSVAFSADGKVLASGSEDKTIKLWEVATGHELHTLTGHLDWVTSVALSTDGKMLASGSYDKTVRLWDVSTGRQLRTLTGHSAAIKSVTFNFDGKTLASGSDDKTIKVWDVATGQELRTLPGHSSSVNSVVFSADGSMLASGGSDNTIKLWDVTGREIRALSEHSSAVFSVAFRTDGRALVAGTRDGTIKLCDVSTGPELSTLKGHSDIVSSIAFSPSGTLASSSYDQTIKLWEVGTGRASVIEHSGIVFSVAFSPDGKTLASGSADGTINLYQVSAGTESFSLDGHSGFVTSVAFSGDGKTLASGSYDKTIKLWDVSTGRQLRTFGHSAAIQSVAFNVDGKTLASGSSDKTIKLWDVSTGRELRTLKGHSAEVRSVVFSRDGKVLASGSLDHEIKLWDAATGRELQTLTGHSGSVTSVVFSGDGRMLASGSADATVKLWSVDGGELLATLIAFDENDWTVITPDGLFDGSSAAWNKILWRFNNNTFNYVPVEAFFSDFYYPGLLTDIFAGKRPKAPSDIAQKDRRQPQLKLTQAFTQPAGMLTARNVTLRIDLSQAEAGAQDVRLFRNGSLVRVWPGDVLKGQSKVTLEATIPIVAGENRFTAYAFNRDNIKSRDETLTVKGADSLKRPGTLHVIAVGIGTYANSDFNLDYTPDDATSFGAQLKLQQEKLGQYKTVEVSTVLNEKATKENILAELKKLSGVVQPEDAVVVYFSGHGKADGDHFYLLPHDLGYSGSRSQLSATALRQLLTHSISDVELEEAFRGIDAGRIFMIIDACNSGQAVENKDEPRRGPMNTRGLAQLAHEKGISILTASQNVEEAFVSEKLKHSYLTFALVEEGLKTKVADENGDGQVTLREWFSYASTRVPKLREETLQSKGVEEVTQIVKEVKSQKTQTPRTFYRRESEAQPFIVAKAGTNK